MRLFFIVLFLCIATQASPQKTVNSGYAQSETYQNQPATNRTITPAQWHQLTDDKAFGYKNDKEAAKPHQSYKPGILQKILSAFFNFFGSGIGRMLLWLVVISVVVYVILRVVFSKDSFLFGKSKKVMNEAGLPQQEEDITITNWEALQQQATANNDLRLAIRYSYMWLLQMLQQQELIKYRNDKTNYEYYTELNETSYKQPFRQLSRQYEYAWYGRFNLSGESYNEYMMLFNNLKQQLGS